MKLTEENQSVSKEQEIKNSEGNYPWSVYFIKRPKNS